MCAFARYDWAMHDYCNFSWQDMPIRKEKLPNTHAVPEKHGISHLKKVKWKKHLVGKMFQIMSLP